MCVIVTCKRADTARLYVIKGQQAAKTMQHCTTLAVTISSAERESKSRHHETKDVMSTDTVPLV